VDLRERNHQRRFCSRHLPETILQIEPSHRPGFDFTAAMYALCIDIASRMADFRHLKMNQVLIDCAFIRKNSKYGVQARVTPMRFAGGSLTTRRRDRLYGIERYFIDDREMLYLLTFMMPRFLAQSFEEKIATVIHELYHMAPEFNGDIRRLPGRCSAHSHSKKAYHDAMHLLAKRYLESHDKPEVFEFLKWSYREYQDRFGGLRVLVVPRPRLVPITRC
jgi:predicted metallopeptidase